jgi:ABC-type glycerol-3-phosphate transport system substrate-binding protein
MIPRRTLLKAAGLAAAATIIRPAFADSEFDSLYAKARKEGGLNLYGGGPADWYTQWAKQFEAAFPDVPIAFIGGFSNELSPKIDKQIADKKLECDVTVLQTLQDFERWKQQGALTTLLMPFSSMLTGAITTRAKLLPGCRFTRCPTSTTPAYWGAQSRRLRRIS